VLHVTYPGRAGQPRKRLGSLGALAAAIVVAACGSSPATGTPGASIAATSAVTSQAASGSPSSGRPWMDAGKPVGDRVAALLGQMTLDEKIGQMTQIEKNAIDAANAAAFNLGSILSGGGGFPDPNTPQAWYDMVNAYQGAALGTRLGIPILYGVDAVHGHNNVEGATIFPQNVGLGATNDPALVQQVCAATAVEMNATGIRWDFGPVVAVPQDIRWGRTFEGYGEDTDLVSRLGSACIKGLQGSSLSADGTAAATAKHFIGDGGTAFGTSTASGPTGPYLLDQGVDQVDEATLLKLFLPPYKAAVDDGARIVMTSYSSTTAGKVHGDRHLITDILKGQLGFSGFVVSDWGGVDQVVPGDYQASLAQAINAGIDMVMVPTDGPLREPDARPGQGVRGRVGRRPRHRPNGCRRIGRPAQVEPERPADPCLGQDGPPRRSGRRRHRDPVRRLDDHLAGFRRADHLGHDAPGSPEGDARR